jgi:hypothetical protein
MAGAINVVQLPLKGSAQSMGTQLHFRSLLRLMYDLYPLSKNNFSMTE